MVYVFLSMIFCCGINKDETKCWLDIWKSENDNRLVKLRNK